MTHALFSRSFSASFKNWASRKLRQQGFLGYTPLGDVLVLSEIVPLSGWKKCGLGQPVLWFISRQNGSIRSFSFPERDQLVKLWLTDIAQPSVCYLTSMPQKSFGRFLVGMLLRLSSRLSNLWGIGSPYSMFTAREALERLLPYRES
jgi:hypothetical protein